MSMSIEDSVLFWLRGVDSEITFWRKVFASDAHNEESDFRDRLRKKLYHFHRLASPGDRILDVGSGPLSCLGTQLPDGGEIALTPCDALAPIYNVLHEMYDIKPEKKIEFCLGENLVNKYSKNSFAIVHSQNALDHTINPMHTILNMLAVCKVNGFVILEHRENEAEFNKYDGLHHWNFRKEADGDMAIWNKESETSLRRELGDYVTVDTVHEPLDSRKIVVTTMKKLRDLDFELPGTIEYDEVIHKVLFGCLMKYTNFKAFNETEYSKYLMLNLQEPSKTTFGAWLKRKRLKLSTKYFGTGK